MARFNFSQNESTNAVSTDLQVINQDELKRYEKVLNTGEVKWIYIRFSQQGEIPMANITVTTGMKEKFETPLNEEVANELIQSAWTGDIDAGSISDSEVCKDENFVKDILRDMKKEVKLTRDKDSKSKDYHQMNFSSNFQLGTICCSIEYSSEFESEMRKKDVKPEEVTSDDLSL